MSVNYYIEVTVSIVQGNLDDFSKYYLMFLGSIKPGDVDRDSLINLILSIIWMRNRVDMLEWIYNNTAFDIDKALLIIPSGICQDWLLNKKSLPMYSR